MIRLMSQTEAERGNVPPSTVQNISPFLNPAHVLAPPRHWLDALASGKYSWSFFRLRYKSLLRDRFRESPERFHSLLDASEGQAALALTCHCLDGHCHREPAREFLEYLRTRREASQTRRRRPKNPPPPAREWARGANTPARGLVLASLIEQPVPTSQSA